MNFSAAEVNFDLLFPGMDLIRPSFIKVLCFLGLYLKKFSDFLKCSGVTDLHVLKKQHSDKI